MKKTLILVVTFAVLLAAVVVLSCALRSQHNTVLRLQGNQSALLDTVTMYKTKSNQNAATVHVLELTKRELEQNCSELTDEVKALGIKLRKAEQIAQAGTKTEIQIQTVVRDSIIYVERTASLDTLRLFEWTDPWVSVNGEVRRDSVAAIVASRDTLTTVLHRKKTCLFKKAEYWLDIVSHNPHTTITYETCVQVAK